MELSGTNDERQCKRSAGTRPSRRQMLRLLGGGISIVLAPLLAACGLATDQRREAVEMTFRKQYSPSGLTVRRGTTIVWQNQDTARHTATCDPSKMPQGVTAQLPQGAQPWDSGELYMGQQWAHTFDTPGRYVYACRYAGTQGMIGTITVTE